MPMHGGFGGPPHGPAGGPHFHGGFGGPHHGSGGFHHGPPRGFGGPLLVVQCGVVHPHLLRLIGEVDAVVVCSRF